MKDITQYYSDLAFMFIITIICICLLTATIKGIMVLFNSDTPEPLIPQIESIIYSQLPESEKLIKIANLIRKP